MITILKILSIILFVTVGSTVQEANTKISSTRNPYRQSVCLYYTANYTEANRQSVQSLIDSYSYLSDDNIQAMIFEGELLYFPTDTILIVITHCIALGILILIWPGLCFCCACPDRHPVCKRCRKQPKQMYGKCQLKWPAYATLFSYLIILVGAAAALYDGPNITNYINNYGCRILAIADDTLYGRIHPSDEDIFFVGLQPFASQLTNFKSRIDTFFSESNNSLNASANVRSSQSGIQSQISSEYTSYTNIQYNNAFRQSNGVTYIPIDSEFKTLHYGPINQSSKILGNINIQLSSLFTEINAALDPMIAAWNYLEPLGASTVSSYIDETINNIGSNQIALNATIQFYSYFQMPETLDGINLGFKFLYGLIASLAALGIISTIVLTCCTVVRVRMIIYFTCSFLIILGIVTFALTIFFSYALPNAAQICNYADRKLSTPEGTYEFFDKMRFYQSAALFKNCITNGTGNMIPDLSPSFEQSFQAIDLLADYTLTFNDKVPNFQSQNFDQPFDEATTVLANVKQAKAWEIPINSVGINFIQGVTGKLYTVDAFCTNPSNVNSDSWTPSKVLISCKTGSFQQDPCSDLSDLTICPLGCYQIYQQLTSPSGDPSSYAAHLNSRYGTNCNYANYISDLHNNWNLIRAGEMNSVQTDLDGIKSNVDNYDTSVKAIQAKLNAFKSNLETNYDSETNLQTGSFNGFNCQVLGVSIQEYRDAACVGVLTSIQFNFIMTTIISYGILLLACFSVCAGVRHFQHLKKMQTQVGYKGVPIAVSSKRIIDGFDD